MTETVPPGAVPASVSYERGDAGLIVRMVGEIDISSWPRLEETYNAVVGAEPGPVTIDLSRATFVDSTTLGFLIRLHNHVARQGKPLVIVRPHRTVLRAMQVCGLDSVLTIDTGEAG